MGVKICQWSALYGQFVFMLHLRCCRWPGCERWKGETILGNCWKDFEACGQLLDSENAFSRNSYNGSMMLKTCFVCGIAGNSVSFVFLLLHLSFCLLLLLSVGFMLLLHPYHSCVIFFHFIMSFFLYKHISQSARLLLPAITWNWPHTRTHAHTHSIHSCFTL
jgi:hypothetical protein